MKKNNKNIFRRCPWLQSLWSKGDAPDPSPRQRRFYAFLGKTGRGILLGGNAPNPSPRQRRLFALLRETVRSLLLGGVYYLWLTLTGLFIPCPVRLLTGYLCPGCGITHCILALTHLDFKAAFEANAFVFCLLPAAVPYGIYRGVIYVRRGACGLSRGEIIVFIFLMLFAIAFALYRNGFFV